MKPWLTGFVVALGIASGMHACGKGWVGFWGVGGAVGDALQEKQLAAHHFKHSASRERRECSCSKGGDDANDDR